MLRLAYNHILLARISSVLCKHQNDFMSSSSQALLTRLHVTCEGIIEENGYGMLQVRASFIYL